MKTFAFLLHPTNIAQVKDFWPLARLLPGFSIKFLLKFKNFNVLTLKKITSLENKEIQGYLIVCSLLPAEIEEIRNLDEELLLDEIISAGFIAQRLGARIMGLGGYLALAADKKPMIYKHLRTPITNGSAFSAWSIFETIFNRAQQSRMALDQSTIVLVEPANAVGSLCARKFCQQGSKIILTGQPAEKLEALKANILALNPIKVEISADSQKAIGQADILINFSSSSISSLNLHNVKPQTIVCDASVAKNITQEAQMRKDIIFIPGSMVKLPSGQHLGVDLGWPADQIAADLAETMLLTLEERYVNYSLGENINLDNLEDIANIAVRHGFEVFKPGAAKA